MTTLSVRTARAKQADHISIERQNDVVFPCYLMTGPTGKAWIEQPSGKKNGWCVHLAGQDVGDHEKALTMWLGAFADAKQYAIELVK